MRSNEIAPFCSTIHRAAAQALIPFCQPPERSHSVLSPSASPQGKASNGTITLGGVDPRLSDGPIAYVPDAGHGFHSVAVASFILTLSRVRAASAAAASAATGRIAENVAAAADAANASARAASKVTIPVGQPAILDTGTNVLLLPPALLSSLASAMCADATLAHCTDLFKSNQ